MGLIRASLWFAAVVAAVGVPAAGANTVTVNLARDGGTVTVPPGPTDIVLLHRIPGRRYEVTIQLEDVPVKPLEAVQFGLTTTDDLSCTELETATKPFRSPPDEKTVEEGVKKLPELLKASTCQGPLLEDAKRLLAALSSVEPVGSYSLRYGQQLTIVVRRMRATDALAVEKTWTVVLTTGPRGQWLTTYGMSFVPDRNQRYFLMKGDQDDQLVITAEQEPEKGALVLLPTVMFSWLPASRSGRNVSFSPTAGLGAGKDSVAVVLGGTVTYNWNLGFTAGVAISHQLRLRGTYQPGQVIAEPLTEEQLHTKVLKAAPFFAVTFRFGQNPFGGGEPAKTPKKEDDKSEDRRHEESTE